MSEAFLRKIAPVVDLDVVRTSTLSALHRTVRANDPEITKFWKRPDWSLLGLLLCDELSRRRIG